MTIDGRDAHSLSLYDCTENASCDRMEIWCPEQDADGPRCTLHGEDHLNVRALYAINGWDDLEFVSSNKQHWEWGMMHYGDDYEESCSFGGDGVWECDRYDLIVGDEGMSWSEAEDWCLSEHGRHLVSIHNASQNIAASNVCADCWIGAREIGNWSWSDDSSWTFSAWDIEHRYGDDGDGDCVHLCGDGVWNDTECSGFIVHRPLCGAEVVVASSSEDESVYNVIMYVAIGIASVLTCLAVCFVPRRNQFVAVHDERAVTGSPRNQSERVRLRVQ